MSLVASPSQGWDPKGPAFPRHPSLDGVTHLRILGEDVVNQPFIPGAKGTTAATHTWNRKEKNP
jgi:hypothetical protein